MDDLLRLALDPIDRLTPHERYRAVVVAYHDGKRMANKALPGHHAFIADREEPGPSSYLTVFGGHKLEGASPEQIEYWASGAAEDDPRLTAVRLGWQAVHTKLKALDLAKAMLIDQWLPDLPDLPDLSRSLTSLSARIGALRP